MTMGSKTSTTARRLRSLSRGARPFIYHDSSELVGADDDDEVNISVRNKRDGSRHNIFEEKIDSAFRIIRPQSIGFFTWKVENGRVESVSRDEIGVFNDSETYIVYAAAPNDSFASAKTVCREAKPSNQPLNRFIHFWLGANTTAERSGTVAYKVIELDKQLGNTAVQFRETQGNESVRFRSYFKDGIIVLSQTQDNPIRLFEVRGKKCPTCVQRPVDWSSFSSESTMLFQTRKYVYVWLGRASSPTERRNGLQMAERIKDMYDVPEITTVDDGYEKSISELKKTDWNAHLCLSKRIVHPLNTQRDGLVRPMAPFKLYRCGFANSKYRIEEVKTGSLQQTDLNDVSNAFIVDGGELRGVWIWLGRSSLAKDKAEAMRNARGFVKKKKYTAATPVVRVIDGSEPMEFKRIFPHWRSCASYLTSTSAAAKMSSQFDAHTLMQRPKLAAMTQLIDDGSGTMNIYKVPTAASNKLIEVPRRKVKALFSGDCFLVHYMLTGTHSNLQAGRMPVFHEILYLWVGAACSAETAARGEKLSSEMFEKLRRDGIMQARVHEGWETPHFLQIFKGKLIVLNGKSDDFDVSGGCNVYPVTFLLKVSGDSTFNSKAVQVSGKSAKLSSKDCLVLNSENEEVWVWCGQNSTGDKREIAKTIGTLVGDYSLALESSEPDEFWRCLPETVESKLRMAHTETNGISLMETPVDTVIGLFVLSSMDSLGVIFQQINSFEQSDLTPEDVFLLDTGSCVFVWVGKQCLPSDQKAAWTAATSFLLDSWAPRSKHTSISVVHQGSEPVNFIGHFPEWNSNIWENHKSFEVLRSQLDATSTTASHLTLRPNRNQTPEEAQFDRHPKYPLDVLRNESSDLPDAVNRNRKEIHLTHDDFIGVFSMRFAEFETLPEWRKQQLKKLHKLF